MRIENKMLIDAIETWPMMTTPWPAIALVTLYVPVVTLVGPKYMDTRPAKPLKSTVVIYNFIQISICSLWLYQAILYLASCNFGELIDAVLECSPLPQAKELAGRKLIYFYYLMKLTELIETVIFVLRKKQNQVSFLHVYHHTNMAIISWYYTKHVHCLYGLVVATINTFVHVVMYTYYLLASLGPSIQPYLWWKKYLTGLQIVQLVYVIMAFVLIGIFQCNIPWGFTVFMVVDTASVLVLFLIFYKQSYVAKTRAEKAK